MNNYALWFRRNSSLTFFLFLLWTGLQLNAQSTPGLPVFPGPVDTIAGPPGSDTGCAGMTVSVSTLDATSCDPCNGWVIIDVSGGTPPYSGWKVPTSIENNIPPGTGGNQFVKSNLCPGTHTFVILDSSQPRRCKVETKVTISGCRPDTMADTVVAEISGTIQKAALYTEEKAYPNPFADHTYVGFYSQETGNADLFIYNGEGAVIHQTTVTVKKGHNMLRVNGTTLAKGMYYVRISTSRRVAITKILRR